MLGTEVSEVVVVGPDFKCLGVPFEVVTEGFESAYDGQEFFVVDVVVLFGWLHGFGVKGDGVPSVQGVGLFEDGAEGEIAGVCDETERSGVVG